MDHHLVSAIIVPATVERVACRYPWFRKERQRISSFARGPSHVWALRRRAQQGYFFHADLQATLCFGCGGQYPLHAQTCPRSDYDLPEIPPSTSNPAQEMNINIRPLHGTRPSVDYADVNIRRESFHQQRALYTHTWTQHLADAGFYASKSFTQHTVVQLSFLFSFWLLLLLSFFRFVWHIFINLLTRRCSWRCFC